MEYSEKLKDLRWQKKRLEILNRDGFRCQECLSDKITLHVHHRRYVPYIMPWEYPDSDLITVCENCHSKDKIAKDKAAKEISLKNHRDLLKHRYGNLKPGDPLYETYIEIDGFLANAESGI